MATHPERTRPLRFRLEPGGEEILARPQVAIVAGYAGRDRVAVERHILELEKLGVAPPSTVPTFYPVPPQLVTQGSALVTTERDTSGEAEAALVVCDGEVLVAVGSDHTDRAAERLDVALSKRACEKMVGSTVWRLDDVLERWDQLRLQSWIGADASVPYQDCALASLLPPRELLAAIPWRREPRDFVLFCGTGPTLEGICPSPRFLAGLLDPLSGRSLTLEYAVETVELLLPLAEGSAGLAGAPVGTA